MAEPSGSPAPRAAVIVPTAQVDAQARRCIAALYAAHPWAELHLVPDALPDPADPPLPCALHPSGPVSIAAKRNLGAAHTKAPILAFIDSDAWPDGDWLGAACGYLETTPELGAVGGPNISPPGAPRSQRWVGRAMTSLFVSGPGRFRKLRDAPARDILDHLPTCNLVVRAALFQDLGGMNPALFAGEDRDFCERLLLEGARILFTPEVRVFHEDRDLGALFAHRFRYGATLPPILRENVGRPGWKGRYLPLLLPAAFVGWAALGPALWILPGVGRLHRLSLVAYGGALTLEAARLAREPEGGGWEDLPGIWLALALGNVAPGVGIWSQVLSLGPGGDLARLLRRTRPGRGP